MIELPIDFDFLKKSDVNLNATMTYKFGWLQTTIVYFVPLRTRSPSWSIRTSRSSVPACALGL